MKTHIRLERKPEYANVITCGSPERAEWFSGFLDQPKVLERNREYHSFLGKKDGQPILILSHGVGSAGAAIAFHEVIDAGAKRIIRIGTAGGLQDHTGIGDLVVPSGAIRQDGTSKLLLPVEYPAVPNFALTMALMKNVKSRHPNTHDGVILTSDLFYPGKLPSDLAFHRDAGVTAVEMECATLFTMGFIHQVATAAVVALDGNPLKHQEGVYDPSFDRMKQSLENAFHAVVDTLIKNA